MSKRPFFYVKKRVLLIVAGIVWLAAGVNVARLGILAYFNVTPVLAWHIAVSVLVFAAFGFMFFKMTVRHKKRIIGYEEEFRPIWNFFDLKGYIIMAVMMGGGIGLRYSGVVPEVFITVFYTGLGCALSLAGVLFLIMFFRYPKEKTAEKTTD